MILSAPSSMPEWFKWAGSLVLLACFLLPMTSCTGYFDSEGRAVTDTIDRHEPLPPGVRTDVSRNYLLDDCRPGKGGTWSSCAVTVAAFVAPVLVVVATRRYPHSRTMKVIWFLEPVMIDLLVDVLDWLTFLSERDVGWYVAAGGITLYALGWSGQAWGKARHASDAIRSWHRRRTSTHQR